jgi:superfamily II DNA or RNA helicase
LWRYRGSGLNHLSKSATLRIVHTKELAQQAIATAVKVLGIPREEIGLVGNGKKRIGDRLTVALVQSLDRSIPRELLKVGQVVVDECHRCPSEQTSRVIRQLPARYLTGLTATPYRRDGLDKVIAWTLGPIRARICKQDLADRLIHPVIVPRDTGIRPHGDGFHQIVENLLSNEARNDMIVADVAKAARAGWKCLVLSDRVDHVERLSCLLRAAGVAAASLHGGLDAGPRSQVVSNLGAGTLTTVVATGQLVGEGFDCPFLSALFLATPVSFSGRLTQYVGRVSRTSPAKTRAMVIDYGDECAMLWSGWHKRSATYRQLGLSQRPASRCA